MVVSLRRVPSNLAVLSKEDRVVLSEMLYRSQLKESHSHSMDSPLLKSRGKVKRFYGD